MTTSQQARAVNLATANHYVLEGTIAGTVDTSGVRGTPVVSLQVDGEPTQDAQLQESDTGLQVTALLDARPDLDSRRLLLLLPTVNTHSSDGPVPFAAVAVVVTARTSIGGPRLIPGPVHSYEVHPVAGTASFVEF